MIASNPSARARRCAPACARWLTLSSCAALAACTTDTGDLGSVPQATEVAVDPTDFLGDVPCSTAVGALRSYVVTLSAYDDESDITPFVLGSSPATPCALRAGFRRVVVGGKLYTAEVDGYDLGAAQLVPFGGASSGSRQMRRAGGGEVLTPRWTTHCGHSVATAAQAEAHARVFVRDCDPLQDSASSPTALSLTPSALLGPTPCDTAGAVDVEELGGAFAPVQGLACDADPVVLQAEADRHYQLYLHTADGQTPARGAECFAVGREQLTVTPTCAPLSSTGGVRLRLDDLLVPTTNEPVCPAGYFYDVLLDGDGTGLLPLPCEQPATLSPLEPGTYLLEAAVFDAQGQPHGAGASCGAEVVAGRVVDAFCLP